MLSQETISIKITGSRKRKEREKEDRVRPLPEKSNASEIRLDAWCPYANPAYTGPYSTLDAFPEIAESIKTQTLRPDLITRKFRQALDTNILNLYACKLNTDNIRTTVLPFLEQNPQIAELRIDSNNIVDAGAKLLATNRTIKKLNVNTNKIMDDGVIALCQNKNITCLHMEYNNLTEKGIEALANNSVLIELHISFDQLHKNINIKALDFFLKNDTLKIFRCSGVSASTLEVFWKELTQQRTLRDQNRKTAFLMGCHSRLGKNSPILTLYKIKRDDRNISSEILSYIKPESLKW